MRIRQVIQLGKRHKEHLEKNMVGLPTQMRKQAGARVLVQKYVRIMQIDLMMEHT
jgi:hypothetical protein